MSLIVKTWIDLRFAFRRAATRDKIMGEPEKMIDNMSERIWLRQTVVHTFFSHELQIANNN